MSKKYTFPRSVTLEDKDGKEVLRVATQTYQIGIYVCAETGDGRDQLNLTPAQIVKYMKQFDPDNLKEGVTSQFGPEVTVQEVDGFWKEVA